jgi:hypothetical protein
MKHRAIYSEIYCPEHCRLGYGIIELPRKSCQQDLIRRAKKPLFGKWSHFSFKMRFCFYQSFKNIFS